METLSDAAIDRRVFETAFELWSARSPLMKNRLRLKRFTYGDQWGDMVTDTDGTPMCESDRLLRNGRRPITNNLIRRLVKTIVGRYRDMATKNKWYDTDGDSMDATRELDELDSRLLEEFLISGMAVQRVADDDPMTDIGPQVVNVSPDRFFCNDFRDPRGHDIEVAGMVHDMSPGEVRLRFGKGDPSAAERVDRIMAAEDVSGLPGSTANASFFVPQRGRVRVIEIWTREIDTSGRLTWRVRWFAPSGQILATYLSPWGHGSHPYVLKFYPLTDGEVHSFVEDVVDQQRYINRLIILIDRILATSAKGVLLFPVNQKTKDCTWEEIGRRWASTDGIIPLTGSSDVLPQQIHGAAGDASAYRLLEMELKLFDQTAGVGSALLGNTNAGSGVTGQGLYQAQVENATIALADIFRTFRSLVAKRDFKLNNLVLKKKQQK